MNTQLGAVPPENGGDRVTATRAVLAQAVAAFTGAWDAASEPPELAAHLPAEGALRRSALIELIKVDLQHRSIRKQASKRLDDYRAEFPELDSAPLPPDLIYEEISARRQLDQDLDLTEYEQRYSLQMARIAERLDADHFRTTLLTDPAATATLDTINPGATVDDFDMLILLGQGAFGRVFLARQRSMQRLVAVKISHDRGSEGQTLAQLDHEHIVRVFDQRHITDQHLKLMYMQYVPGGTLLGVLRLLRRTGVEGKTGRLLLDAVDEAAASGGVLEPQPSGTRAELARLTWPETVAWLGSRLASALDYANRAGVLHRDIKPANVLLTVDGQPKLADFNISFSRHIPGASPAAYFGGSLAYMSPEQLEACHPTMTTTAADLDTRSDLYALAVVLWELLTGRLPFDDERSAGESDTSVERMIELRRQPIPASFAEEIPQDCPSVLQHTLLTCLSPDPADRFATGAELANQLDLTLDRTARDLVDPPSRSIRAKLKMRPMPVVTLSSALGQLLGGLYLWAHNTRLLDDVLTSDASTRLQHLATLIGAIGYPIGILALLYWCRLVFLVPDGLRRGKQFDDQTLAHARADTLACGDRIAVVAFTGWALSLVIFLAQLHYTADLSAGFTINLIASHLVAAAVAVVYSYFPVTFFVLRWYYPGLLGSAPGTPDEAVRLRQLARRSRIYLGIAASVPLIGVVGGLVYLDAAEQQTVITPIVILCVVSLFAFVGALRVFYALESDLHALDRIVNPRSRRSR
ncbi:serine/threonine protein kinase [Nocardia sp. NBC_00565]|uniref:serine/threonine-protein kinase n=1 Tax=Nocardia sp. NBC_00565 TaxID=2975993 RepID=UPI002E80F1B9|nr:serine/threonine-protein kinase [Nocardia sp. NBC_00565]WUC06210.1 serine/threonine protein kinase [Nocardia sp. NBC_00565]